MKQKYTFPIPFFLLLSFLFASCKKDEAVVTPPKETTDTITTNNNDNEEDTSQEEPSMPVEQAPKVDSIITLTELPSVWSEAVRLHQGQRYSNFRPTGFILFDKDTLIVNVESLKGARLPKLLVGTYSRYRNDTSHYNPVQYTLHEGKNVIKDDKGGILWLRYENDAANKSAAKVSFVSGMKPIPYFQLGETSMTEWRKMLEKFSYSPDVLLEGKQEYVVVSMKMALDYKHRDMAEALRSLDEILDVEDYISGMDSSTWRDYRPAHKILMTETDDDVYFYSTYYRTAFVNYDANILLEGHLLKTSGWGVWHELGHQHQQPAWTWSGLGECTVNLYSLRVERHFGNNSRLHRDGVWKRIDYYVKNTNKSKSFNDLGVWMKLGMFWQLWLKYGDDFYIELHQITRAKNPNLPSTEDKMLFFMKTTSKICGHDLTNFFKKWGFDLPQSAYNELAALNLPQPEEDITLLTD